MIERVFIKAGLINAHPRPATFGGIGKVGRIVRLQLPLARDAGAVAGILQQVTKGAFLGIKDAKVSPVTVIVFPGHDLHSGRRTKRLGVGVGEPNPRFREAIKVRRPVRVTAITAQPVDADIIGHDEDDIGTGWGGRQRTGKGNKESDDDSEAFHG